MLNFDSLKNLKQFENKWTAQCPACALDGADDKGDHLAIFQDGSFACIMFPGEEGHPHRQRIYQLAGVGDHSAKPALVAPLAPPPPSRPRKLLLPPLRKLTMDEMATVAQSRKWPASIMAPGLISHRELLWYGLVRDGGQDHPAWVVTDSARCNAQARRMDGQLWEGIGGKKAKSIPGSDASWPIGAPEIGARLMVLLLEGQPDFCAALLAAWIEAKQMAPVDFNHILEQVAPVCMTGASLTIHPDALVHFEDKHVRIAVHADSEGWNGALRWKDQLYRAGAKTVDAINFSGVKRPDGQPIKDLADYATLLTLENPRLPLMLKDLPAWLVAALHLPQLTRAPKLTSNDAVEAKNPATGTLYQTTNQ